MSEDVPGNNRRRLEWSEIAPAARTLFRVWHDGTELEWAEHAWATLCAAGLTNYGDDIEQTRVKVRLLALAMIYREFCQIGRDEDYDERAFLWEEGADLNFSNVRLGQLVGPAHDTGEMDADDSALSESALFALTAAERPAICRELLAASGGESQLAEALFATSRPAKDTDPEDEDDEPQRNLFDESLNDAARVVEWIANDMTL